MFLEQLIFIFFGNGCTDIREMDFFIRFYTILGLFLLFRDVFAIMPHIVDQAVMENSKATQRIVNGLLLGLCGIQSAFHGVILNGIVMQCYPTFLFLVSIIAKGGAYVQSDLRRD